MTTQSGSGLDAIAAALAVFGLAPILDEQLEHVRARCAQCSTVADDEVGYRPLVVAISKDGRARVVCDRGCDMRPIERLVTPASPNGASRAERIVDVRPSTVLPVNVRWAW